MQILVEPKSQTYKLETDTTKMDSAAEIETENVIEKEIEKETENVKDTKEIDSKEDHLLHPEVGITIDHPDLHPDTTILDP
jgi:hypothetical protein